MHLKQYIWIVEIVLDVKHLHNLFFKTFKGNLNACVSVHLQTPQNSAKQYKLHIIIKCLNVTMYFKKFGI